MHAISEMVKLEKLRPIIHKTFKLSEIRKAHEEAEKGSMVGKIVIEVSPDANKK